MDIMAELAARLQKSHELAERGAQLLSLEVVGTVFMPFPLYIREAQGSRVVDVDGNKYIDLTMGFGPHVLGHSPEVVIEAVREAAGRGLQRGLPGPEQQMLAELIVDASPCAERVAFYSTGSEATQSAIRLARGVSGKTKIGLFDGGYHGSHDQVLVMTDPQSSRQQPMTLPRGAGIPPETLDQIVYLPYRVAAALDMIRAHSDELAAVIIEPIQSSNPRLDCGDFLRALRDVCSETGVLLILDEVITGFRLGYGGGQAYFDVVPDLVCYGKAIGGGMPIGAVAGRAELMEPLKFSVNPEVKTVFSGGTFAGNPMSMIAGAAALGYLRDHPEVYTHLEEQGSRFTREINAFCEAEAFPAQMLSGQSMFYLKLQKGELKSARDSDPAMEEAEHLFDMYLNLHGVTVPGIHLAFISAAHSAEDIDQVIAAYKQSFYDIREAGLI